MPSGQVVELFRLFSTAGVRAWLGGGWAVDAIVGHQTREHNDVDLAVDARDLPSLLDVLDEQVFTVTTDWAPSRLELTAPDGRVVDIHPVTFAADGSGRQAGNDGGRQVGNDGGSFHYAADGFATGTIDGSTIPCLSAKQQLRFREGYELRSADVHDIELLKQTR